MEQLLVQYQVAGQQVTCEIINIDLCCNVTTGIDRPGELVEAGLDHAQCEHSGVDAKLRLLDVDRNTVGRGYKLLALFFVVVIVQLEQGSGILGVKVNAVVVESYLLGEVVAALVGAVDIELNGDHVVG